LGWASPRRVWSKTEGGCGGRKAVERTKKAKENLRLQKQVGFGAGKGRPNHLALPREKKTREEKKSSG